MSNILNGSTILVADDDPVACGLLEEMLDGSGAHLIIARSGSEAIDALATNEPDVAILDVRMPEPGGLAILQHLRNEGKDIPVLIVTGYSSSSVAIESTSYGAYDYLRCGRPSSSTA
jgi:two-component system response regulator